MFFLLFCIPSISGILTTADNSNHMQCALKACNERRTFLALINGTCYRSGRLSSSKNKSAFQRVYQSPSKEITLFRIVSGSGVSSYDLYNQASTQGQPVADTNRNYSSNFRSILLDEWRNIRPLYMNVTIRNYEDSVVGYFLFKVNNGEDQSTWFKNTTLVLFFPWNIATLFGKSFTYFSIKGFMSLYDTMMFNIAVGASCKGGSGALSVFDRVGECAVSSQPKGLPQVIYAIGPTYSVGQWSVAGRSAKSLEITGIYDSSISIYT